jgi:hypothetical protein
MSEAKSPVLPGSPVAEFNLGHGFKGFEPIPVVALDEETFVSRHGLSDEEVDVIVRTRELYVMVPAGGPGPLRPVRVVAEAPEYTLRVLALDLQGARRELCHGLEVTQAGGSEADRVDYVVAEAAALLASRVTLPCRVEILNTDTPKMMEGGQECPTAEVLERALTTRLKKALDYGDRRVEVRAGDRTLCAEVAEMTPRQIAAGGAPALAKQAEGGR